MTRTSHLVRSLVLCLGLTLAIAGCGDNDESGLAQGIFAEMGAPLPSATAIQKATFARGREVALRRLTPADGLGPKFNVTFCSACHEKPVFGGGGGRYRNFLLIGQELEDGSFVPTGVNGVQPQYTIAEGGYTPSDPNTNVEAQRNPIPFFGVGLLAEITDEEILSRADPDDADGDGISGRPNYDRGFVGRFGRKAQNVAIESFIRGPLFTHMGITTNPLSPERRAELPVASTLPITPARQVGAPDEPLSDDDSVADPEMAEGDLFDLVSFAMLMAAPMPSPPTPDSIAGEKLFGDAGCDGCHVPSLVGPRGRVPAYTDLLLHDMGPELADGIVAEEASGSEFRTTPLWGVTAVGPYLHDGRADTLDQAIRGHGGEAQAARDAYVAMADGEKSQVLAFLRSLGGADQRSDGLLVPNAPIPPAGEYGGPITDLGGGDLETFVRGRALFDLDTATASGLGPNFNGDSCRACHFDPVIGGSGPLDVNVTRHAIITNGVFSEPAIGTMAHRHTTDVASRPPLDPNANYFESRQTPALFGLGLIDRIPEATILALEDPDDLDTDDISGRAHVTSDGRIGRLGWKANVPSLAEFSRDAMLNELGITVPDQPGLTFGAGVTDDDEVADPEITAAELDDLTFFMANLAPPPRFRLFPQREDEGEELFDAIECTGCHVPVLMTADNTPVPLFSDLLLHDVAPPYLFGFETDDAEMTEFRTAPLWGLSTTAPYMHDGSAATIEEAILLHDGEAAKTRDAYLDLPPSLQQRLLDFLYSL